jgi:hypothetical protein
MELRGDRDAGPVLRRNADRIVRVPMAGAAIPLDTPQDPQALDIDLSRTTDAAGRPGYHSDPIDPGN